MIEHAIPPSARAGFLAGEHNQGHTYRMALYEKVADLGRKTNRYTAKGEVVGKGYVKGGQKLTGWKVVERDDGAHIEFDSAVWPDATIKADGAMIYNDSLPSKPVVAVLPFDEEAASTNAPFIVRPEGALIGL